ncbi:MAG: hypothetical protein HPY44_21960 [Armatimonadetes bacterium]|nr:hypothetical protein [Armatimonadota bacterium]
MAGVRYAVVITGAPPAGNFLAKLFGADPRKRLVQAIRSVTAMDAARAAKLLDALPKELARFNTEQEAKVAAQTLEDEGARCEVRAVE